MEVEQKQQKDFTCTGEDPPTPHTHARAHARTHARARTHTHTCMNHTPVYKVRCTLLVLYVVMTFCKTYIENVHSCTVHLDTIKVFIYQLMHKRFALKEC
jgi:hypothetical protein